MEDLKSLGLEEFIKNNEEVPDALDQDARKSHSKTLQDLHNLEADLQDLDIQLEAKRTHLQEYIAQGYSVLSPIRRLPADILHEIFYHCLSTSRDPLMSSAEAPLLLTRICRAWRQTAYSSPRLWSRLYIMFSDEDTLPTNKAYATTKRDLSHFLQLRCDAVEAWLSRSGACPLTISIFYKSGTLQSSTDQEPIISDTTSNLLRVLAQHSNRWEHLELRLPIQIYRKLESQVQFSQLPLLRSLRSLIHGQSRQVPELTIHAAHNLSKLSLSRSNVIPQGVGITSSNGNPTQITELFCHSILRVDEAKLILRNCPNVERVAIQLVSNNSTQDARPQNPPNSTISLPRLRSLAIVDFTLGAVDIYDHIDAPRLEWLDYTKKKNPVPFPDPTQTEAPVNALLQKCDKLKKLIISTEDFTTTQLRTTLECADGIKHLVLSSEIKNFYNTPTMKPSAHVACDVKWNLGDLFLQENTGESANSSSAATSCFLPHLEVLEILRGTYSINDEIVRDIILRRMHLVHLGDTPPLKRVVVCFERPKKLDIRKEIFAGSVGQQIELKLSKYPDAIPSSPAVGKSALSSQHGVGRHDRTWSYTEFEDQIGSF